MPTIRIAATTATAVSTASTLFTNPTGRPDTRDQSSSVTTANSTRRSRSIATTMTAPRTRITTSSLSFTVSGWPNRYVSRFALSPPPRLTSTTPSAMPE